MPCPVQPALTATCPTAACPTAACLQVRRDAFDEVQLPVHIRMGVVRSVRVKVPWSNLGALHGGEPVRVAVDGIFIVVGPSVPR